MSFIKCDPRVYARCPTRESCEIGAEYAKDSECAQFAESVLNQPAANADRIRAMSDEEMAEFIGRIEIGDFGPQVYGKTFCDMCKGQYECDDCRLWWLQQPAEED